MQPAPPARGPARLPSPASGHSQEVLHRDADDRAFYERPWRLQRQWRRRRRRGRTLFLARDLRRGISGESSLGGQGDWCRRFLARCRHSGFLSFLSWLPFPPTCSPCAPAPGSRATCPGARLPHPLPGARPRACVVEIAGVSGHAPPSAGPGRPKPLRKRGWSWGKLLPVTFLYVCILWEVLFWFCFLTQKKTSVAFSILKAFSVLWGNIRERKEDGVCDGTSCGQRQTPLVMLGVCPRFGPLRLLSLFSSRFPCPKRKKRKETLPNGSMPSSLLKHGAMVSCTLQLVERLHHTDSPHWLSIPSLIPF